MPQPKEILALGEKLRPLWTWDGLEKATGEFIARAYDGKYYGHAAFTYDEIRQQGLDLAGAKVENLIASVESCAKYDTDDHLGAVDA